MKVVFTAEWILILKEPIQQEPVVVAMTENVCAAGKPSREGFIVRIHVSIVQVFMALCLLKNFEDCLSFCI